MSDRFSMLLVTVADDIHDMITDEVGAVSTAIAETIVSTAVDILAASGIECTCGAEAYQSTLGFDHPCLCHCSDCDLVAAAHAAFRQAITETTVPEQDPDKWTSEEIAMWRDLGLMP